MSRTATTELEIPGIVSGEHRPKVVVSYGLGLDSTCLLLRWLTEPETRDFDLADMVVLTAMTGDEFRSTSRDVETYILPLFRRFGVRYIQCARSERTPTANGNGVVVLDDSTCPQKLYSDGAYRLSTEMLSAGTVPQLGGKRACSIHAKGWALDPVIKKITDGQPYRHVIGFEAGEQRRAAKDQLFNTERRRGWYPLIEAGMDRQACADYVFTKLGVSWSKSCCSYCVFALSTSSGRANMVERYRQEPQAGAQAMLIEATSRRLNERQTLIAGGSVAQMITEAGLVEVEVAFREMFDAAEFAVYEVRRVTPPGREGRRGITARSVRRLARGTRAEMDAHLSGLPGRREVGADHIVRHHLAVADNCEHFFVVAPAVVDDKQRPAFETHWAQANGAALF
ncbi:MULTISPECIES: hypothetical protein [Mycobacteriaceae]|jgi:hypothetical protein|uniref:hypothetical protein n=1 Tax=Mycobacteriaceae TaxID=1762 RepID=UPI0009BE928C|nr:MULTISPECIES: hypothetical protein [Mycobacteriaceae]MCF6391262.1 hypothetical protein [Mycobacterium sp. MBM]UXA21241.1 hypothetical protein KXD98_27470 [Mycobacterium sp. SMC-4]